ncbi:unnamed protein product [Phytophthora lilii]|uniref:Unnamed protein product n=1 Tax=Phytophthora lilii TaxID=2077276 RepID=A0A9W6TIS0_9STRA|nr:unnamed protein product [Phytophthora lilii]
MVFALATLTVAALASLATSGVDAHGTLSKPGLTFTGTGYGGNFQSDPMNSLTPLSGDSFTNYPDYTKNAAAFARSIKASKYKSLKEFMYATQDMSHGRFNMPKTTECGFTDPISGPVQTLPDEVEWYGGMMIHDRPCEIWCDDEVVLPFTENCRVTYPDGKFPYEKSKCVDKSRLTMYWLGTLLQRQVYIDCAKIGENGVAASNDTATIVAAASRGPSSFGTSTSTVASGSSSSSDSNTTAPAATAAAAATDADNTVATVVPTATTQTPTAQTSDNSNSTTPAATTVVAAADNTGDATPSSTTKAPTVVTSDSNVASEASSAAVPGQISA